MDFAEIVSRWKEFGALGVIILVLAKLGDKAFVWLLDVLGVNIKRGQSREDTLDQKVEALTQSVVSQDKRLTRVEGAYEFMHDMVHRAADGIEAEMEKINLDSVPIKFFISQLRTIQTLDDIYKD